mmetsp:Transcript_14522/g.35396  ORF Transcript_14522/g.35396 Transcript_14522/m.35396 type:complete len:308 (-) Transcript_14522:263-1186(-)|eukprot:CAMPEP_0114522740 /NCGR_PEP_ID=MMETSP0109-20121206/20907_1 /TAXON_ID=29199 /ORGANISM="Chlorarachnion reptans, Strain CCCM449" /LENGTH=307 /DNA_ID=CAMNT_0001703985 /DNA_START=106 /DNA_END=1029 /DNA_ORIENTATION=-
MSSVSTEKVEKADGASKPSSASEKDWVYTPYGFGELQGENKDSGISQILMPWGTQYTRSTNLSRKLEVKIVTFHQKLQDMTVTVALDQTSQHIRAAVCKKFKCSPEEVRLVNQGLELTGEQMRMPISKLRIPSHEPPEMLFVHEARYKFQLDRAHCGKHLVLSGDLLSVSIPNRSGDQTVRGNVLLTRGRLFWDVYIDRSFNNRINLGVCIDGHTVTSYVGQTKFGWAYYGNNGKKEHNGGSEKYGPIYTTGDTIRVMVDMDSRTLSFQKNGQDLGLAFHNIPAKVYPAFTLYTQGDKITLRRFGTF